MKIYIILYQYCDDCSVVASFTDELKARRYYDLHNDDSNSMWMEESDTDSETPECQDGYLPWEVCINKNGDSIRRAERISIDNYNYKKNKFYPTYNSYDTPEETYYKFFVLAEDEEYAIKIAKEKHAWLLANNLCISNKEWLKITANGTKDFLKEKGY